MNGHLDLGTLKSYIKAKDCQRYLPIKGWLVWKSAEEDWIPIAF